MANCFRIRTDIWLFFTFQSLIIIRNYPKLLAPLIFSILDQKDLKQQSGLLRQNRSLVDGRHDTYLIKINNNKTYWIFFFFVVWNNKEEETMIWNHHAAPWKLQMKMTIDDNNFDRNNNTHNASERQRKRQWRSNNLIWKFVREKLIHQFLT